MPKALIWGASGGIGNALVNLLIDEGWEVYGVARQSDTISDRVTHAYEFNARDADSIAQTVHLIAMETDVIDLMVYAVGGVIYDKLEQLEPDGWLETIHANVTGAFYTAQRTLPLLSRDGHMVFIGAYIDHIQLPKMGAYVAAKAALEQFAVVLAKENRRKRVTVVRPGAVNTGFWEQVSFSMPDDAKPPSDIAKTILRHHNDGSAGDLNL